MIKEAIQQEAVTLVNMYAPNTGAPKCIKNILRDIKGDTHSTSVKAGCFNTPLTSDRSSRWKINKGTVALSDTLDQVDLIDIVKAFHPTAAEYIFFSSVHRMC